MHQPDRLQRSDEADNRNYLTLVLASASPRRKVLSERLGLSVVLLPADIDETPTPGESPEETAVRLAREKALVALRKLDSLALSCQSSPTQNRIVVLGADTIVVAKKGGEFSEILGKPASEEDARTMLERLRAEEHRVITGLALIAVVRAEDGSYSPGAEWTEAVSTAVWMRDYADEEIAAYIRSGSPLDKAGAYGIQDRDFSPVERIEGCYLNVVGLPLCRVAAGLASPGHGLALPPGQYSDPSSDGTCRCGPDEL